MTVFGPIVLLRSTFVVPIPENRTCLHCQEGLTAADAGVVVGPLVAHEACFVRGLAGSVGHQCGLCHCPGRAGVMEDPPGMTTREAAQAAMQFAILLRGLRPRAGAAEA